MRRKGELTRKGLNRDYPHHVALPAETVRGLANSETVRSFAASLGAAQLTYHLNDPDRVVFCFKTEADAKSFSERFGGERLAYR